MMPVLPAEIEPHVKGIRTAAVAYRIIHKVGVGVIGVVLLAVVAAVIAAAGVLEQRQLAVVRHRVGAHYVEPPREKPVPGRLHFVIVAHQVVDDGAARTLVVVFADRAVDVFHVHLGIELRAVARLVPEFGRSRRRSIARSVIIMPVNERAHGAELGSLATNHALFGNVYPELARLYTEAVEHERLDVVGIGTVALVRHLLRRRRAFLSVGLRAFGRASGSRVHVVAIEPGIERTVKEVVAEYSRSEFPMHTVVVRSAAHKDIVLGNHQVIYCETPELHKAYRVIPLGIGVVRHVDVEFARVVRKILVEVILVPRLEIAAQRRFQ